MESASPQGYTWDIFDHEGRWPRSANAPERDESVPPFVRGEMLYQVEADELGVQSVAV